MCVNLLLPFGAALVELVGVGFRYLSAYTLYFCFVRVPTRPWMLLCLLVLGLYTSSCVFGVVGGLVMLVPAITAFASASANGVLLFYAYQIYVSMDDGRGPRGGLADML